MTNFSASESMPMQATSSSGAVTGHPQPEVVSDAQIGKPAAPYKPRYGTRGFAWAHLPTEPFTPWYWLSFRGADQVHIVFWVLKGMHALMAVRLQLVTTCARVSI